MSTLAIVSVFTLSSLQWHYRIMPQEVFD